MNGYELSRIWFNWCFENPDKIKPNHTALYFFCIEHCNRLGWKEKFGLPTTMAMEAIGIKSYNTYKDTIDDLVEFGFVSMIERSKNQYSANIIALSKFDKALDNALDKATATHLIKHITKQLQSTEQSTIQSIDSIDKQITNNNKQTTTNKEHKKVSKKPDPLEKAKEIARVSFVDENCFFGNDFKKVWLSLIQQSKWKSKSQTAINLSLRKLMKYDEVFAIVLVENSISGNYQGVVFPETDAQYQKFLNHKNGNSKESAKESRDRMVELATAILTNGKA